MPKYPITVRLSGTDGHALMIVSTVQKALKKSGCDDKTLSEFKDEALSGDYDHVIQTAMKWVEVE